MEAEQHRLTELDRLQARLAMSIVAPPLKGPKSKRRVGYEDLLLWGKVKDAEVVNIEEKIAERRAFFDKHREKFGNPKR